MYKFCSSEAWSWVCVFETASQFISLISAAFCAPISSLTLQHIQSIGRKKEKEEGGAGGGRKIPLNLFCSLKGSAWKKEKREWNKKLLHLCRQPKSSPRPRPKAKLKRPECWDVWQAQPGAAGGSPAICPRALWLLGASHQFKEKQAHTRLSCLREDWRIPS